MALCNQKSREYLDRGLDLLKRKGYVEFSSGTPHLTGEFHDNYVREIYDVGILGISNLEIFAKNKMLHRLLSENEALLALEKTLRSKGSATQDEVICMSHAVRYLIAEINKEAVV